MIIVSAILLASLQIAQVPASNPTSSVIDTRGPCLDSAKQVPNVVGDPPDRSSEILRIDRVVSTATFMPNEVIGFVYTRQDGKTFLGMRAAQYTSPASAAALNAVLASTHAPSVAETAFPPQTKLGVKTGYAAFFEVRLPAQALAALQIRTEPCVAWPLGRPLPEPAP
ncbi:MAG: hypothetical protein DLM50_01005 [Candidatus Meridianibacter frigidus]|nr:MAG: hypothetical protein DLM50_01005 [Candidatus Eremiobacteraeota bacterium]